MVRVSRSHSVRFCTGVPLGPYREPDRSNACYKTGQMMCYLHVIRRNVDNAPYSE